MARNEEKALSLFSKWNTFKSSYHTKESNRRPLLASECESVNDAKKWRREIVQDVSKKIAAIHNATLGEHRIREMNDEINKMTKQVSYWDRRIRELGGDVSAKSRQFFDVEGKALPGQPGYKYYGAAKDLPGIRELFAEEEEAIAIRKKKRSRADLYKFVTPDYYGYRDDDDGILQDKEAEMEVKLIAKAEREFTLNRQRIIDEARKSGKKLTADELAIVEDDNGEDEMRAMDKLLQSKIGAGVVGATASVAAAAAGAAAAGGGGGGEEVSSTTTSTTNTTEFKAHVVLPSNSDLDAIVTQQKKMLLLSKIL